MKDRIPTVEEMDEHCTYRKCLKFINPTEFPMAFVGTPYQYDKTYFACFICEDNYGRLKQELEKEIQPYPITKVEIQQESGKTMPVVVLKKRRLEVYTPGSTGLGLIDDLDTKPIMLKRRKV